MITQQQARFTASCKSIRPERRLSHPWLPVFNRYAAQQLTAFIRPQESEAANPGQTGVEVIRPESGKDKAGIPEVIKLLTRAQGVVAAVLPSPLPRREKKSVRPVKEVFGGFVRVIRKARLKTAVRDAPDLAGEQPNEAMARLNAARRFSLRCRVEGLEYREQLVGDPAGHFGCNFGRESTVACFEYVGV